MVAISLYRGNLHRVPDIPRQWVMPRSNITVKEFRSLLRRRSKALSLLKSGHDLASTSAPSTISSGNQPLPPQSLPPLRPPPPLKRAHEQIEEGDVSPQARNLSPPLPLEVDNIDGNVNLEDRKAYDLQVEKVSSKTRVGEGISGNTEDLQAEKDKGKEKQEQGQKNEDPNSEGNYKLGTTNEKETRKREVEEKLEVLNNKKHNLVQALKQILSAEEDLKRRSNVQHTRPSISLQVDVSNDSGSMTRVVTPRTGSETNVGGNTGGDNVLNHDLQSRHIPRMSSISPSAESSLKRSSCFQHNSASNPSRSSAALVHGSPIGFAFPGSQAQASKLPPVSPAASVGTSSFKDARSASS